MLDSTGCFKRWADSFPCVSSPTGQHHGSHHFSKSCSLAFWSLLYYTHTRSHTRKHTHTLKDTHAHTLTRSALSDNEAGHFPFNPKLLDVSNGRLMWSSYSPLSFSILLLFLHLQSLWADYHLNWWWIDQIADESIDLPCFSIPTGFSFPQQNPFAWILFARTILPFIFSNTFLFLKRQIKKRNNLLKRLFVLNVCLRGRVFLTGNWLSGLSTSQTRAAVVVYSIYTCIIIESELLTGPVPCALVQYE